MSDRTSLGAGPRAAGESQATVRESVNVAVSASRSHVAERRLALLVSSLRGKPTAGFECCDNRHLRPRECPERAGWHGILIVQVRTVGRSRTEWSGARPSTAASSSTMIRTCCCRRGCCCATCSGRSTNFGRPPTRSRALPADAPDVILLDANFGRGETNSSEGLHWLSQILKADPEAVVVMITAHGGAQRRGRGDEARRDRLRDQALVERAAAGDGADRGVAAPVARRRHRPSASAAVLRARRSGGVDSRSSASRPAWRASSR